MALTYNTLNALTKETIMPNVVDNIFNDNPVFDRILRKAKVRNYGTLIRVPIENDVSDNFGGVAKAATLTNAPSETHTQAYVTPKMYYANISVYGQDLAMNKGTEGVIDLLEASAKNAQKTLANDLATDMYGTQSTNEILGFRDAIQATGTSFEGIDPADFTNWESNGGAGKGIKDVATTSITMGTIRTEIVNCIDGSNGPDLITTTKALWSNWAGVLEGKERLVDHKETTKHGFQNFTYMGIPVVADAHVPDTYIFILNLKHYYFAVLKGHNFKAQPYRYADNKDVYFTYIFWRGALVCDKRKAQGGIQDVSAIA